MIAEAIILAGGLGTRLRSVVSDLPKCMAPVAGHPFLHYVIGYYRLQGIRRFIFSLGYKHEMITDYLTAQHPELEYDYVIEDEPLGTGGAIQLACSKVATKNVLVLNGDTLFRVSLAELAQLHEHTAADCTLCLKPMQNFDRYGVVETAPDQQVISFREKQFYTSGTINGGVYALNAARFLQEGLPGKFSFEKDYLETFVSKRNMYALIQDAYFIDIGIPDDYAKANREFEDLKM